MKKAFLLCLSLVVLLTGCTIGKVPAIDTDSNPNNDSNAPDSEQLPVEYTDANIGFNNFDSDLIFYMTQEKKNENYMISPLSFKYALGLATIGAEGTTKEELLKVVEYDSIESYKDLSSGISRAQKTFNGGTKDMDASFNILNSIWNTNEINPEYIEKVKEYIADVDSYTVDKEDLVEKVNSWVDGKTNGLIKELITNANNADTVLVNSLYLKTNWAEEFSNTKDYQKFTAFDGTETDKSFMTKTSNYKYYKDDESEVVVVPLYGGIKMAFVIGNNSNILNKLSEAETKNVKVVIPKIELETSFDDKEFLEFLNIKGASTATTPEADFSFISQNLYIDDIIQKTKLVMDEDGIEAAAATAIVMTKGAFIEQSEPIDFIADKPFEFYIYTDSAGINELMFYGQIVK